MKNFIQVEENKYNRLIIETKNGYTCALSQYDKCPLHNSICPYKENDFCIEILQAIIIRLSDYEKIIFQDND